VTSGIVALEQRHRTLEELFLQSSSLYLSGLEFCEPLDYPIADSIHKASN